MRTKIFESIWVNLHLILKKKNNYKCAVVLCSTLNNYFAVISMRVRPEMAFDIFGENILDKWCLGSVCSRFHRLAYLLSPAANEATPRDANHTYLAEYPTYIDRVPG